MPSNFALNITPLFVNLRKVFCLGGSDEEHHDESEEDEDTDGENDESEDGEEDENSGEESEEEDVTFAEIVADGVDKL